MSDSGDLFEDEDLPPTPPPPNSRGKLNCVLFARARRIARQIESIEEYDSESGDSEYECESENSEYECLSENSEYDRPTQSEHDIPTQRQVITLSTGEESEEENSEYDRPTQRQVITVSPGQEREEEIEAYRRKLVPEKKKTKIIRKPTQRQVITASSKQESEEEIEAKSRKLVPEKKKIDTKNIRKPLKRNVITASSEQESEEEGEAKSRKLVPEKKKIDTKNIRKPTKRKQITASSEEESEEESKAKSRKLVPEKKKIDTKNIRKPTKRKVITASSEQESEEESEAKSRKLIPEKKKINTKIIRKPTQRQMKTLTVSSVQNKPKKRRIRKLKKCEICGKSQLNIWRHKQLMHSVMHSDGKASTSKKKMKKKTSKKGYIIRVCPFTNCVAVRERMRDHLVRTHKMKTNSRRLQYMMNKARPVMEKIDSAEEITPEVVISDSESEPDNNVHMKKIKVEGSTGQSVKNEKIELTPQKNDKEKKKRKIIEISDSESEPDFNVQMKKINVEGNSGPRVKKEKIELTPQKNDKEKKKIKMIKISDSESEPDYNVHMKKIKVEGSPGPRVKREPTLTPEGIPLKPLKKEIEKKKNEVIVIVSETESELLDNVQLEQNNEAEDPIIEEVRTDCDEDSDIEEKIKKSVRLYNEKQMHIDEYKTNNEMKHFVNWLQAVPSLKSYRTSMQHAKQAYMYWVHASPKLNIPALLEPTCLNGWMSVHLNTKSAGTLRSYLSSVRHFIDYLTSNDRIKEQDFQRAARFKEHINTTSKSLSKRVKIRRTVIETEEIETMLLPVDFQNFMKSDISKDCEQALTSRPVMEVYPSMFYNLRDYLILRIMQANAQRPMAVRGISENSIRTAKRTPDGGAVILVAHHKTAETGPVMLFLSKILMTMLENYTRLVNQIPNLQHDSSRPIFITWPKEGPCLPMDSSLINKAMQRIWSKGPSEKRINATRIRKATSTAVRSAAPRTREVLAKHMSHSPETADRYYALHNQREMAGHVGQLIESVMHDTHFKVNNSIHWPLPPCEEKSGSDTDEYYRSPLPSPIYDPNLACSGEEGENELKDGEEGENELKDAMNELVSCPKPDCSVKIEPKDAMNKPISDPKPDCSVKIEPKDAMNKPISDPKPEGSKQHKRRTFSEQDASILLRLCRNNLESGNVYRYDIMTTLTSTEEGRLLVLKLKDAFAGKDYWKIIVDRVHAERRRRRRKTF